MLLSHFARQTGVRSGQVHGKSVHPVLPSLGVTLSSLSLSYRYHLRDVVVGKIYFLLVRIKIKHMELSIIKRETSGSGANVYNENETLVKHEIMDGAPVRGL